MNSKIFLGKYRVAAEEMAAVGEIGDSPLAYEAKEIDSGNKVVVEVVPASSLKTAVRQQLEAEAMAARKLSHVNMPALCDFGVEDDRLIYVTEDFEGTSAEEWVNAHGPMPVGPVLRIASQVVSALGAAAVHQINHHAINPSNLVLVPGQTAEGDWPLVKVLHFVGVAPKTSGTDVAVAAFDKSLPYASPEQIQKGTVDFRSELFSLGATMWFLLTGAPPLVAPAGSMATPPAKTGVAAEKIDAIPKKVRRLLAQMLAVNPEERPGDPLGFYRTLLDCLQQVERRETMARRLGVPLFSPSGLPRRRPVPIRALALAALFLAIATVGAVVVSGYLRHGRIVRAEEEIGKPIGVPEASASATPADASVANAIVAHVSPPTVASTDSNTSQSVPIKDAEADTIKPLPTAPESVESSTREVAVGPAPPPPSDSSKKDLQSPEPAPVIANSVRALPPAADLREVVPSKEREAATPGAEPRAVAQQTAPRETIVHEVRRAQPAEEELAAIRTEPAPPGNGPESVVSETTTSASEPLVTEKSPTKKTESVAKQVRPARPAEEEPAATRTEPAPPGNGPESAVSETTTSASEPLVVEKSPTQKNESVAKPKRQAEKKKTYPRERISDSERTRPRSQARTGHARLVGVTPEGWLMLRLPSNRIIVVPPPPSSR